MLFLQVKWRKLWSLC